jgi:hypothetical protein
MGISLVSMIIGVFIGILLYTGYSMIHFLIYFFLEVLVGVWICGEFLFVPRYARVCALCTLCRGSSLRWQAAACGLLQQPLGSRKGRFDLVLSRPTPHYPYIWMMMMVPPHICNMLFH